MQQVSLFNNATAILSMRNSDFDANSAYGEVIDNSIQAKAKDIKVFFKYDDSDRYEQISSIAFADNGHGMPKEIIHKCLQLGYSSRFNDRNGIGRFGVGATLAGINQCKKIEIYSKEKGKDCFYTYIDIDEITSTPPEMQDIPEPIKKDFPNEYENIISEDQGTLVVWSKYDKQDGKASEIISDFKIWAGRTYRKFIWKGLNIYINGASTYAIDPLYVNTDKTEFPDDPKAKEYPPIEINWPIPRTGLPESIEKREDAIIIKMSILPKEFRPKKGSGGSGIVRERYIDMNEGISILRNEREVFYGHIPYMKPRFVEADRWWGCEISFNAILDNEFSVKTIKQGALPNKTLRKLVSEKILPTRKSISEKVNIHWATVQAESEKSEGSAHKPAEEIAKNTSLPKSKIDEGKNLGEEIDQHINKSDFLRDASARERARWEERFRSQPFTIYEEAWGGDGFFDTGHLGGNSALLYNTRHVFIEEVLEIIEKIKSRGENKKELEDLRFMIDMLVMSFAKAEASFEGGANIKTEDFLEQLKNSWGNFLSAYIKTMRNERSGS